MSANSALDGTSPMAGSMAPRKNSSSPIDDETARRKISLDDSSCTTAWNSRWSTRAHSVERTASRDRNTIGQTEEQPDEGAERDPAIVGRAEEIEVAIAAPARPR